MPMLIIASIAAIGIGVNSTVVLMLFHFSPLQAFLCGLIATLLLIFILAVGDYISDKFVKK